MGVESFDCFVCLNHILGIFAWCCSRKLLILKEENLIVPFLIWPKGLNLFDNQLFELTLQFTARALYQKSIRDKHPQVENWLRATKRNRLRATHTGQPGILATEVWGFTQWDIEGGTIRWAYVSCWLFETTLCHYWSKRKTEALS